MPGFTMPTRVVSEWLLVSATIILEQSLWKVVILESFFIFFVWKLFEQEFSKVLRPMMCLRGRVHIPIFKETCCLLHILDG